MDCRQEGCDLVPPCGYTHYTQYIVQVQGDIDIWGHMISSVLQMQTVSNAWSNHKWIKPHFLSRHNLNIYQQRWCIYQWLCRQELQCLESATWQKYILNFCYIEKQHPSTLLSAFHCHIYEYMVLDSRPKIWPRSWLVSPRLLLSPEHAQCSTIYCRCLSAGLSWQ